MQEREKWRSGLGFALAASGSAIGLGNLWGFAYRASQGGGAAFLFLYLLIVLVVCLPVFVELLCDIIVDTLVPFLAKVLVTALMRLGPGNP